VKRLFYLSAAILMLSLAFHFGYSTAKAQSPGNPVVALIGPGAAFTGAAITANGDVYSTSISALDHGWTFRANIFNGGATPALQESWGQLKSRYAPKSTPAPSTPTDR
jgi:hypothetical protein